LPNSFARVNTPQIAQRLSVSPATVSYGATGVDASRD
jgi:hypothetical protein